MPAIPTAQNRVQLRGLPQVSAARIVDTTGQSIANAAGNIGEVFSKIQLEERNKADRAAFMEADTATSQLRTKLLLDPETGARNRRGKEAIGSSDEYLKSFDDETTKIANGLKSDRQKIAYRESVSNQRNQLTADLNAHEGAERERFYDQTRKSFQQQSRDNAITYHAYPERIESEIGNIAASVNSTPGIDDAEKQARIGQQRSEVYAGVIDRYLVNDQVGQAEKYYKSIKDKVSGEALTHIESGIRAAKNRLEAKKDSELAELRYQLADEYRNLDAAFKARVPITSVPSEQRSVALLGETRGKAAYAEAQDKQRASAEIAKLDSYDAAKLAAVAKDYRPKSQQSAALDSEVYNTVGNAINDILTERNADPVGYLQRKSPAVQKAYTRFNQEPNDRTRTEYLQALNGNKAALGISGGEILSKDEERSVVERMTRQDDSVSLVNSISGEQARWGDDFDRVFQQVGKDLPESAYLIPNVSRNAANILATVSQKSPQELQKIVGETKVSEIEDSIVNKLDDLRKSFPVEGAQAYSKIQAGASRLAIGYIGQGVSQKNAIDLAIKEVADGYEFTEFRDHTYRVPKFTNGKPLNLNDVSIGANVALRDFTANESMIDAETVKKQGTSYLFQESERLTNDIRERAYWVTAPDESGLELFLDYQPISDKRTVLSWDELAKIASDARAKAVENYSQRQLVVTP